jgi:hypothetical protein
VQERAQESEIQVKVGRRGGEPKAVPITAAAQGGVIDKFRKKYGAGDVKKYYSKFDVAVVAEL